MKHTVDARGLACPLPVVNTKAEIETMQVNEEVEVLVDNEIAVQNLTKFANVRGYDVTAEKKNDTEYHVYITVRQATEDAAVVCTPDRKENMVVVLSSHTMGTGDDKLGTALMKAFVFALTKQDRLPDTVLLYNSGAWLSVEGADTLQDLQTLQANGVEIYTCGTCLNFYGLTDKLAVGQVTNMYDIVDKMESATKIIRP
ncbi:MAG: sulfurtransferase-like selenium metabolism protein YedF [Erysipelotrichaceae bacterium]|nr:sulfurtransferase-like selenium metabolism protein YedF [Erysipelotrichaceae bacterium]